MPGLAHDELQRDFGVAEMGGGTVAQLVQVEPGVGVQQDAGAVVAEAGAANVRADVGGRRPTGRDGAALGQEQRTMRAGAAVREAEEAGQQVAGDDEASVVRWTRR
ncbi:hypothetical protein [Nonomuraea sp. KM90]|uniref:hypothetical protein n=1 Tax=Nonomuraea sp. KM90 TaxID=3457428 RepID=UPI003FCCC44D